VKGAGFLVCATGEKTRLAKKTSCTIEGGEGGAREGVVAHFTLVEKKSESHILGLSYSGLISGQEGKKRWLGAIENGGAVNSAMPRIVLRGKEGMALDQDGFVSRGEKKKATVRN